MRRRVSGAAFGVAALLYVAAFLGLQTPGLFDRSVLEWDARAFPLVAFRFHGTGLFPGDFIVDALSRYEPPLWKLVYWLGTLVTDPYEVSKLLPFLLFALLAWQAYALGRAQGGFVLGALCVVSLCHCSFVWNRLAGGNPRAFGFPLLVAFIRYVAVGAERRTLGVLFLQAVAYPSALMCCAPAYALVAMRRGRGPLLRAIGAGAIAVTIAAATMWGDQRMGAPPTLAQAETLLQMRAGGPQPYFPPPPLHRAIGLTLFQPFHADGEGWRGLAVAPVITLAVLVVAVLVASRLRRGGGAAIDGAIFFALPFSGLCAAAVAQLFAYRFYLPDRILQLAWIPTALLALPLVVERALRPAGEHRSPLGAALVVSVLLLGAGGDGMVMAENLTQFGKHDTAVVRYLGRLPKDVLIATHPDRSSYIQMFAHRRTLFSASANMTFLYEYARELERRMEAFYRAYYAGDREPILTLRRRYAVDYLVVDLRDFGGEALARSRYYEPWRTLNARLLTDVDPGSLLLAHVPAQAIAYEFGHQQVIDLRRLEALWTGSSTPTERVP